MKFGTESTHARKGVKHGKAFGAALVYAGLGERDEAFRWLDRSIDLRAPLVTLLKVDPRFDPLRQDPRFAGLLRRIGLPP